MHRFSYSLAISITLLTSMTVLAQEKVKSIRTFEGHTDKVTSVAVAPDGKQFISGSDDKTIHVWDIEKTKPIKVLKEHQNYVLALAFSRDGKRVLSAGGGQWRGPEFATESDQFVRVWDAAEWKVLKKYGGHQAPVWSVAFSPDGSLALSGSGGYETKSGKLVPAGHALHLRDVAAGKTFRAFNDHESWVRGVAFHPQATKIVAGSWDKTVRIWDHEMHKQLNVLRDHKDHINGIAISPDGKWIVSGGGPPSGNGDTVIRLWDFDEAKVIKRFAGHTKRVWKLAFSRDSKRILSAAADNTIRLWDTETGKETHRFVGHTDEVRQAVFTPDGKHILSASHDKTLRLWEVP